MPHLDANALSEDPVGLAFLGRVLDMPVDLPAAVDGRAAEPIIRVRDAMARSVARSETLPRTRRIRRPVFEAA